jgi:hypothetical protein
MPISNKLDKALILLLRATQPGELQAAQAAVLRLAENRGLDAHGLAEQLMKGGGARGVDPDEVDWYARAQKMLANLHRFEPRHHEFI